ncbi:MAG: Gx transporter family protein [Ruminococcus sp.]|nr:Gx transporter family protein [Ruminococcus sp.]
MKRTAKDITTLGLLLALACAISYIESVLPIPLPLGVKPGLASIVVMYTLIEHNPRDALLLTLLKSGFVFLTRGVTAGILSASGGLLALGVMLFCHKLNSSLLTISISGAAAHNLAQLIAAALLLQNINLTYYLPVLLIAAVISGGVTGGCLAALLPRLRAAQNGTLRKKGKEEP